MNRIIIFSILCFFLACSHKHEVRNQIQGLSDRWEKTGMRLSDLDESFDSTIRSANMEVGSRVLVDNEVKDHSQALYNTWVNTKAKLMGVMNLFTPLQLDIANMQREWSARSSDLESLKEQLENDNLDEDAMTRIDELESFRIGIDQKMEETQASVDSCSVFLNEAVNTWINKYNGIRQAMANE